MNALRLTALASYIPTQRLDVVLAHERLGLSRSAAKVFSKLYDMPCCPIASEIQRDLLLTPCRALLRSDPALAEKTVVLIHAHTGALSGVWGKDMPVALTRALGLRHAWALGTCSNNCVSFFTALDLARSHLQAAPSGSRALIVVGEVADNAEIRVVPNVAIVGDGAAAAVLSLDDTGPALLAHAVHTYPKYAKGIWLTSPSPLYRDYELHYLQRLKKVMLDVLAQADITLKQVDYVIPHNINIRMWHQAARMLGFPRERIFLENIAKNAHCLGADTLINFDTLRRATALREGCICLMVSAGAGGVFGAALWRHGRGSNRRRA